MSPLVRGYDKSGNNIQEKNRQDESKSVMCRVLCAFSSCLSNSRIGGAHLCLHPPGRWPGGMSSGDLDAAEIG